MVFRSGLLPMVVTRIIKTAEPDRIGRALCGLQARLRWLQRITNAGDESLILILSDVNMPGMSGLELLPKAKAMRPDVPTIMITAYGDAETKRRALEHGAEGLLTKPIDFGTLRSEIDSRVERAA